MFGLSLGHLIIVALVILLFGARRLPELGHALGKGFSAFKRGLEGKNMDDDKIADQSHDPSNDKTNHPPST